MKTTPRESTCRNCASDFTFTAGGGSLRPLCEACEATYKWCPTCGYALVHAAFGRDHRVRDGLEGCCKQCKTRQLRARVANGYRLHPRKRRISKLRSRYGLEQEEWDLLLIGQGGRCAICNDNSGDLVVDHCHESGKVRGLLCSPCNKGIGHLRDDPDRLTAAAAYLLTSKAVSG